MLLQVLAASFLFLICLWFYARRIAAKRAQEASLLQSSHNILLVTAHPDDEAFFFTPTIKGILQRQPLSKISLLCLSSGNASGQGAKRRVELGSCCKHLGIRELLIIEDLNLQDGWHAWDTLLIHDFISKEVQRSSIDTVITFDLQGVSSHPNHCSVAKAAIEFSQCNSPLVKVFSLTTVPLFRKYIGIFDVLFTTKQEGQMISISSIREAWQAMQFHTSQFVWYRRAFVVLSRYSLVNNLRLVQ